MGGWAVCWFRQDLRVSDNPALRAACERGRVLPVYILDDVNAGDFAMGGASRLYLHHSLESLGRSLKGALRFYRGDALGVLCTLAEKLKVDAVYWNRCYDPWRMERDKRIKAHLRGMGVEVHSFNASLLWEPWTVSKGDGAPYAVFTPYYRRGCLGGEPPRAPVPAPALDALENSGAAWDTAAAGLELAELGLPAKRYWGKKIAACWTAGERAAQKRLAEFIQEGLGHYKGGRDFPDKPYVSRMSPHLHFGEVSPNQLWYAVRGAGDDEHVDHYCSELGWREFSYYQLYHHPDLPRANLQVKFNRYPWADDAEALEAWKRGRTGIPFVDAGMRELWQTGYMHNRVRMVVGSFLVKNLGIHWRRGEEWFWDTLVDADLASNSASWQWAAGCGADAAPFFRIFNPVLQGRKFDPEGGYVRRFVPEIAPLPIKYLFDPWNAPREVLDKAGIQLGTTYPRPLVDLGESRRAALAAYSALRSTG